MFWKGIVICLLGFLRKNLNSLNRIKALSLVALIDRDYLCYLWKISGTRFEMSRIIYWLVWQLWKVLWSFFSYRPVWKAPHLVTFDIFQDEEKAKLTHSRLLELCRGAATEHVLHKYNIVDPSIASLTSKPAKLVCQLYEKYGAREPGTAHLPPGTSTNSAKDQRRSSCYLFTAAFKISVCFHSNMRLYCFLQSPNAFEGSRITFGWVYAARWT